MIYHKPAPEDTKLCPVKYRLLEPIRVTIRRPDGRTELVGFGIGEVLEVMEPYIQYLVACYDRLTEIPLSDGSSIIDFPESISTEHVAKYRLPDYDELTTRPILPKSALVHGQYYKGRCRNASVARWNEVGNCFLHWREKFQAIFVESIKHPEDEVQFDVFRVYELLPNPKFTIPFTPECFTGNKEDLSEFNHEMWSRPK
jgi:hypothetical protein